MAQKAIDLISVSSDIGSMYAGKSRAPAAFRSAGLHTKLNAAGFEVTEYSALTSPAIWKCSTREPNGARNEAATVAAISQVSKTITDVLNEDRRPAFHLILSGECLYIPAILSADWHYLRPTTRKIGIVYFDADADLHTASEPGGSGNIAGMTLTHLTLRDGALDGMKTFCRPDGAGVVDERNIVLFELNTLSEANKREHLGHLFDNDFRVFTSAAVQRDPEESAEKALEYMREHGVDHIIVHLDVDVIDPGEFPLCNVPSWTGLGYAQTMRALKVFLGSEQCVGLSVAEVNPDHDPGLVMTARLVDDVVDGLGKRRVHAALPWVGEEE
ncbi:Arginase/deacetylase [Karstenula rhodostoma CBS 690.94]|uniref:Arginase/deacetylase n=1 Tax=Karstenula rhodostoma CBS 690.94 TaxID=1392251 RepID=A0A9P4UDW5_9PLEO|nr:Arginase/deacetylase [Karstenula rhodostoma CBS 690.94]